MIHCLQVMGTWTKMTKKERAYQWHPTAQRPKARLQVSWSERILFAAGHPWFSHPLTASCFELFFSEISEKKQLHVVSNPQLIGASKSCHVYDTRSFHSLSKSTPIQYHVVYTFRIFEIRSKITIPQASAYRNMPSLVTSCRTSCCHFMCHPLL